MAAAVAKRNAGTGPATRPPFRIEGERPSDRSSGAPASLANDGCASSWIGHAAAASIARRPWRNSASLKLFVRSSSSSGRPKRG